MAATPKPLNKYVDGGEGAIAFDLPGPTRMIPLTDSTRCTVLSRGPVSEDNWAPGVTWWRREVGAIFEEIPM